MCRNYLSQPFSERVPFLEGIRLRQRYRRDQCLFFSVNGDHSDLRPSAIITIAGGTDGETLKS